MIKRVIFQDLTTRQSSTRALKVTYFLGWLL